MGLDGWYVHMTWVWGRDGIGWCDSRERCMAFACDTRNGLHLTRMGWNVDTRKDDFYTSCGLRI